MYKQNPKSPVLKALKGNQGKLPQALQDAIKAVPESPAKQVKEPYQRQMGPLDKYNPHKPGSAESKKYIKDYNIQHQEAKMGKEKAGFPAPKVSKTKESPAKQTTAGEFAHKQSIKDKEMGGSTKALDKFTSALEAPFSDKTYGELKKEKRAKQKAKHNAKTPAKQTADPKTPVGPKAEKPKTKKEVFIKKANKKRYK